MANKPEGKADGSATDGGNGNGGADTPSFPDRLVSGAKWAVGGLAAAGSVALSQIGLGKIGSGTGDHDAWAFIGVGLFAVGIALIVVAVAWVSSASRATLPWLLESFAARRIRSFFNNKGKYMLGGQNSLELFVNELATLVQKGESASQTERKELSRLLKTRDAIRTTAASERAARANRWAAPLVLVGVLATTLGATTFAYSVNRDEALAKEVPTGSLLPKTPASVVLVVPTRAKDRKVISQALGAKCELKDAKALVLEFNTPPKRASTKRPIVVRPRAMSVAHVVTERGDGCSVVDLWVPPDWILPRPAS